MSIRPRLTKPAEGSSRWLLPHSEVKERLERGESAPLSITSVTKRGNVTRTYLCRQIQHQGRVLGYQLERNDGEQTYDLESTHGVLVCDCPDSTVNERQCKHSGALMSSLRSIGLFPIVQKVAQNDLTPSDCGL